MGSEESKAHVEHNGDSRIEIVNVQSEHTTKFNEQKVILQIILVVVAIQLCMTTYREIKGYMNRKASKKAEELLSVVSKK